MPHILQSAQFACPETVGKLAGGVSGQAIFGKQGYFLKARFQERIFANFIALVLKQPGNSIQSLRPGKMVGPIEIFFETEPIEP